MVEQGGLATIGINQYQLGLQSGKMAAELASGKENRKRRLFIHLIKGIQ